MKAATTRVGVGSAPRLRSLPKEERDDAEKARQGGFPKSGSREAGGGNCSSASAALTIEELLWLDSVFHRHSSRPKSEPLGEDLKNTGKAKES